MSVLVALVLTLLTALPVAAQGFSSQFPGDSGICNHLSVVFCTNMTGTVASIVSQFESTAGGGGGHSDTDGMTKVADAPAGSAFTESLRIALSGAGGASLYRYFGTNYEELFYRWYVKYEPLPAGGVVNHPGVTVGGQNPGSTFILGDDPGGTPTGFCCTLPTGEGFFTIDTELRPPLNAFSLAPYIHHHGMLPQTCGPSTCFGNTYDQGAFPVTPNTWLGIEVRVKMDAPGDTCGEYQLWLNGVELINLTCGSPQGVFSGGQWTTAAGGATAFPGFDFRTVSGLALNFIRLQLDASSNTTGNTVALRFGPSVIVATERIGLLGPTDTTAPTVPSGVVATATGSASVSIGWAPSTDNSGTVANYTVKRCSGGGCTPTTIIASPVTNSYADTGLSASTVYRYAVAAVDGSANTSNDSSVVQTTTLTTRQATLTFREGVGGAAEDGFQIRACVTTASSCDPATGSVVGTAAANATTFVHATSGTPVSCYDVNATLTGTAGSAFSNDLCTVAAAPVLIAAPGALTFTATVGGGNPAGQSLTIQNGTASTMNWTVSDNAAWLSVSPTSGTNTTVVTVSINHATCSPDCPLIAGTHLANITVSAPGAVGTPATIPVTLNLSPSAQPAPSTSNSGRVR